MVKAVLTGLNSRMGLGAEAHIPWYGLNEKGLGEGRIVLYGAGAVGKDYYMQVKKKPHIELVLWIDKKYEKYRKEGYDVCKLSDINNVQYDKILIATNSKSLAEGIKKELAEKYLIAKRKDAVAGTSNVIL